MSEASRIGVERLVGFDAVGETFMADGRVLRGIYSGHGATYRRILEVSEAAGVFDFGIVGTRALPQNPYSDLSYDLVLEHDRVPFVSYPHEWPAPMLKAAALFHLRLFEDLASAGLTLKDWHPYNILFDGVQPVFVDFTSLIMQDRLRDEPYLNEGPSLRAEKKWDTDATYIYAMYRRMYVPYFLMPLYMMAQGRHAEARVRMFDTTLNVGDSTLTPGEVFAGRPMARVKYSLLERRKRASLTEAGLPKRSFFALLRAELEALDVGQRESGYSSYYSAKNELAAYEPSDSWSAKQRAVYDTLCEFRPATVLDIGSNTGWFSILATRQGASVVALDIDEASVDILYSQARADRLPILPLVLNIAGARPDVAARKYEDEPSRSLIGGDAPLLRSTSSRLACDTVLALALVHHLALGRGMSVDAIAVMLSSYAKSNLVVEFVAINDPLIVAEPSFFEAYSANPAGFDGYTLDAFTAALGRFFSRIELRASNPESRTLLLCSNG